MPQKYQGKTVWTIQEIAKTLGRTSNQILHQCHYYAIDFHGKTYKANFGGRFLRVFTEDGVNLMRSHCNKSYGMPISKDSITKPVQAKKKTPDFADADDEILEFAEMISTQRREVIRLQKENTELKATIDSIKQLMVKHQGGA